MNAFLFGCRSLMRDLRAGELYVLLIAIIVAVAAMTAVGFFTHRIGGAIKAQASAVLAADLMINAPAPIEPSFIDAAKRRGIETAEALSFLTMVYAGTDAHALSMITAVSDKYPLRGEVKITQTLFGNSMVADTIPRPGEGWADPGLLGRMAIDVGDEITVGEHTITVTKVLEYQPTQSAGGGFANLAPGLLINIRDVPIINVIRPGSRVTYREMYAGPEKEIKELRAEIKKTIQGGARVRGTEDAGEQINSAIDRAQRFLTLASLVTVILSAVATAMAARRYASRHLDTVALLKSLGATQGFIQFTTLIQLTFIVLGTAAVGSLIGYVAQDFLVVLAVDFLKVSLPATSFDAAYLGLVTAATITIGFALPNLMQMKYIPPIRVLRRDLPPPTLRTDVAYGVAVGALLAMIYWIVRDLKLVGFIAGGLVLVAVLSIAAGWGLVLGFTRFRGAAGVAWRYGLANISRRGSESVVQIVAFALSLMVLLLLTVVRNDLLGEWQRMLPEDAPNYFLINIEPETWPEIETFLKDQGGIEPAFLPFLRGKIIEVNGISVADFEFADGRGRGFVRQETNLTWTRKLPESNKVQAGEFWDEDYSGAIQVSLDDRLSKNLGVVVGDTMTFDVGGEKFTAPITSLRTIKWDSMAPNFYVMLSPGQAEELPQTYVASAFIPPESRQALGRFVRSFPGVTLFDLEVVMGQVRLVIDRAALGVQYVFLFTLLSGVLVLLAAIQATRDERRFESALLHTLGASRKTILQGIAVEFIALGGMAGMLAAIGATAVGYVMATQVFDLKYTIDPVLWLVGLLLGAGVVGLTGMLATRRAVTEPPVVVLREI